MGFSQYREELNLALSRVDEFNLFVAIETIRKAETVYVAGNGGSAAISEHLCCDFFKSSLRVISLVSNVALNSALSNDESFKQAIAIQVGRLCGPRDVVILVSSSGNSPNILAAAKAAKLAGSTVIGLTGFQGGILSGLADISLFVPTRSYGIAEDAHQALMHYMSEALREKPKELAPVRLISV